MSVEAITSLQEHAQLSEPWGLAGNASNWFHAVHTLILSRAGSLLERAEINIQGEISRDNQWSFRTQCPGWYLLVSESTVSRTGLGSTVKSARNSCKGGHTTSQKQCIKFKTITCIY